MEGRDLDLTLGHIGRASRQIALQLFEIEANCAQALGAFGLHPKGELAALKAGLSPFPGHPLQALKPRRAAKTHLQISPIDAASFNCPAPGVQGALRSAKAGHAADCHFAAPDCVRCRSIARHFATLAWCSENVVANTCPPVPSATKNISLDFGGLSTAAIAARPGLAIGVGGSPTIR